MFDIHEIFFFFCLMRRESISVPETLKTSVSSKGRNNMSLIFFDFPTNNV